MKIQGTRNCPASHSRSDNEAVKILTRNSLEVRNAPQVPIVYKRQNLLSNTTCTPRHDTENHLYENN